MPDELKPMPCPFCGADSKPKGNLMRTERMDVWKHWYVGCVLDGFIIKDVDAWNRRMEPNRIETEAIKQVEIDQFSRVGEGEKG